MNKYLSIEDKKYEVKIKIQNQRIKMYVKKEMKMVNNIDSIHTNIWGECIEPLQNMIKHLDEFAMKYMEKDVIWILKNLKKVSTGIDSLGNKRANYFNALKHFVNMRQGILEGENCYTKQARSAIENSIFAVVRHVLCGPDTMEAADQSNPPEKETTSKEEKFGAIRLLQTSYPARYGNLNKELKNGSYVGRGKILLILEELMS